MTHQEVIETVQEHNLEIEAVRSYTEGHIACDLIARIRLLIDAQCHCFLTQEIIGNEVKTRTIHWPSNLACDIEDSDSDFYFNEKGLHFVLTCIKQCEKTC